MDVSRDPGYIILENIMAIGTQIENGMSSNLIFYANRMKYELLPSYTSQKKAVYLWDLRFGLPDSVSVCDKTRKFDFEIAIPSEISFNFYNKFFDLATGRNSLYDTLYLVAHKIITDNKERFYIGSGKTPLKNDVEINLKPALNYPDTIHTAVYLSFNDDGEAYIGGEWDNGQ